MLVPRKGKDMLTHHTKTKGDIAVLKISADLAESGFILLFPFSDHLPFDLVVYKNDIFYRVQCKYRSVDKFGKLSVAFKTTYSTQNNGLISCPQDTSQMDVLAVYCPETNGCYYIPVETGTKHTDIRVIPPKNNQKVGVRLADEHKIFPY